jgi:hypothetical protein
VKKDQEKKRPGRTPRKPGSARQWNCQQPHDLRPQIPRRPWIPAQ